MKTPSLGILISCSARLKFDTRYPSPFLVFFSKNSTMDVYPDGVFQMAASDMLQKAQL